MVEGIKKGKIEDWMWSRIIERMYEVRDQITLQESIKSNAEMRAGANQEDRLMYVKRMTRDEMNRQSISRKAPVLYSDFEKIILDFQLLQHEQFLQKFTDLYKSVDRDTDGVIDEEEFKELI